MSCRDAGRKSLEDRSEAVEYRIEQHAAKLGARWEALRGVGFGRTTA
jgi:hypothetical protein